MNQIGPRKWVGIEDRNSIPALEHFLPVFPECLSEVAPIYEKVLQYAEAMEYLSYIPFIKEHPQTRALAEKYWTDKTTYVEYRKWTNIALTAILILTKLRAPEFFQNVEEACNMVNHSYYLPENKFRDYLYLNNHPDPTLPFWEWKVDVQDVSEAILQHRLTRSKHFLWQYLTFVDCSQDFWDHPEIRAIVQSIHGPLGVEFNSTVAHTFYHALVGLLKNWQSNSKDKTIVEVLEWLAAEERGAFRDKFFAYVNHPFVAMPVPFLKRTRKLEYPRQKILEYLIPKLVYLGCSDHCQKVLNAEAKKLRAAALNNV